LAAILVSARAQTANAVPSDDLLKSLRPTADVNDFAGILSAADKAAIEARCRELRDKTGSQLSVVTLKSLAGGSLEDFSFKLAEKWGIHQQGKKNGLLLLVAMQEHKSRIEVGYDLEPIIPDVLAGRIIDQQLRPQFRAGQYGAGLLAATNALVELVEKGEPADRAALAAPRNNSSGDPFMAVLFLSIFVAVGGLILGAGLEQKLAPAVIFGSVFSGGPMLVALAVAGLIALLVHLPLALVMAVVGWHLAEKQPPTKKSSSPSFGRSSPSFGGWNWGNIGTSSGGTSSGGWSSGGSGGFSGGWGGFGGGGGGFGGGGASGGW
jgi:uncharacterized protein